MQFPPFKVDKRLKVNMKFTEDFFQTQTKPILETKTFDGQTNCFFKLADQTTCNCRSFKQPLLFYLNMDFSQVFSSYKHKDRF